jgi:hypothetical protein
MDEVVGFVKVAAMRELLAICRADPGLTRWDGDIAHPFTGRAVPLAISSDVVRFLPAGAAATALPMNRLWRR